MALRQRKRLTTPGLPEFVLVGLTATTLFVAALWWLSGLQSPWLVTYGRVLRCDVDSGEYYAADSPKSVDLIYEYTVAGSEIRGEWRGFWPQDNSPNALPQSRVREMQQSDYALEVTYNPRNWTDSSVHGQPLGLGFAYEVGSVLGFLVLIVYAVQIYPRWRSYPSPRLVRA